MFDEFYSALVFGGSAAHRRSDHYSFGQPTTFSNGPLGRHDVFDASQSNVGGLHQASAMADSADASVGGGLSGLFHFAAFGQRADWIAGQSIERDCDCTAGPFPEHARNAGRVGNDQAAIGALAIVRHAQDVGCSTRRCI